MYSMVQPVNATIHRAADARAAHLLKPPLIVLMWDVPTRFMRLFGVAQSTAPVITSHSSPKPYLTE